MPGGRDVPHSKVVHYYAYMMNQLIEHQMYKLSVQRSLLILS